MLKNRKIILVLFILGAVFHFYALASSIRIRKNIRSYKKFSSSLGNISIDALPAVYVDGEFLEKELITFFENNMKMDVEITSDEKDLMLEVKDIDTDLLYRFLCFVETYWPSINIEAIDYIDNAIKARIKFINK
ncbi:MAG: hypothetical protein KAI43_07850 [Candidatus Aureabacteria bacterium]|nr:hypothetical protein [Candidatus Auribacterota bacterium]